MNEMIHITPVSIIAFIVIGICVMAMAWISGSSRKLDRFKAKEVGDGQHGNDRFMTEREAKDFYTVIRLPEEIEDHSGEYPEGGSYTMMRRRERLTSIRRIHMPGSSHRQNPERVQNMSSRTYNTISWPGPA